MIRTIARILMLGLMLAASLPASGQAEVKEEKVVLGSEIVPKDTASLGRFTNRLIVPKGGWQCGVTVMYVDFNSADSDYMLLLQGLDGSASLLRIAPEASFAFRDNHSVGVRAAYTKVGGMLDSATADLLGNMSLSVNDINATSNSIGASVFQRTYVGIDRQGRFGIFWDYILGAARTKSQFAVAGAPSNSVKEKFYLAFAPGIIYFPMNNISIQANISIADFSYSSTTAYQDGSPVGTHRGWKAQAGLNLLNLNFGLTIHL